LCPFHEITGFELDKVLRSENSEENSEKLRLFTGANLFLRPALPGFLLSFPFQIWVSDVTFVTFFGDKKCDASHLSHFWEERDALAHENTIFNFWRFLSHPSRKTSHFGPAGTKKNWTGRNVTIRLGLKHVFLFPSQMCYISRTREAGRPFGLRPTLSPTDPKPDSKSKLNRHISSRSTKFCTRQDQNVTFFGKDVTKKVTSSKKYICVRERHILPRNVTNVTRHIFCHRKKWQMWRQSHKSETGSWEEIRVRQTLSPSNLTPFCSGLVLKRDLTSVHLVMWIRPRQNVESTTCSRPIDLNPRGDLWTRTWVVTPCFYGDHITPQHAKAYDL